MAETPATGGGAIPQTFGQKVVFGIPAIIVALVLAVGISFGILYAMNNSLREDLTKKFQGDMAEAAHKSDEKFKTAEDAGSSAVPKYIEGKPMLSEPDFSFNQFFCKPIAKCESAVQRLHRIIRSCK